MPAMHLSCPRCSSLFEIEPSLMGREVRCPSCSSELLIPAAELPPLRLPGLAAPPIEEPSAGRILGVPLPPNPPRVEVSAATSFAAANWQPATRDVVRPILAEQVDALDFDAPGREARRYITPEERLHRRILRNLVWGFFGLIVLGIMAVILARSQN